MARKELRTVYVSGEEALAQLRMRAARLKLTQAPVELAAETNIADIRKTLESAGDVGLVIIDSIQTMWSPAIEAAPGTVSQVRVSGQSSFILPRPMMLPSFWSAMSPKTVNCWTARAGTYGRYGGLF